MAGRKSASTPGDDMDQVKAQLAALALENEGLRTRLADVETARAGGSLTIVGGPQNDPGGSDVEVQYAGDEPDFGPIHLCRLTTSKVPAGTRTAVTVAIFGTDRRGVPAKWVRRIITESQIPMPADIITRLEEPQTDEYDVPPESGVFEAALRGDLEPAKEECKKMGFEKVIAKSNRLRYIRYIRNYTIYKEGLFQGGVVTPQIVGVRA